MDEEEQQQVGDELRRFQSKSTAKPASVVSLAWGQTFSNSRVVVVFVVIIEKGQKQQQN